MTSIDQHDGTLADYWCQIIRGHLDPYRLGLTDAAVLDAVGNPAGLRVLDLGCGEGYLARRMAGMGARVVGVDLNPDMIDAAEQVEHREPLGITYRVGSAYEVPYPAARFDLVVTNHLASDLDDLDQAAREISRVLTPNGRWVSLQLHPMYGVRQDQPGWHLEYHRPRSREHWFVVSGLRAPEPVTRHDWSLADILGAATRAGLLLSSVTEPHPTEEQMETDPWWAANWDRPMFLLYTAVKPFC